MTIDMKIAKKCLVLKQQDAYKDLELDVNRGYISPELYDIAYAEVEQELLAEIRKEFFFDNQNINNVSQSKQDDLIDLLGAADNVQALKGGEKEKVLLSNHQIINLIVSLQVAKKQLDESEYKKVCDLWNEYDSDTEMRLFNITEYINHSMTIISKFEEITPYYNLTDDESSKKLREEYNKEKGLKAAGNSKYQIDSVRTFNNSLSKDSVSIKTVKKLLFGFSFCIVVIGIVAYSQWQASKSFESQVSDLTNTNEELETTLSKTKKDLHEYQNKYSKLMADNSELNANNSDTSSILSQFDDLRRNDGTMSVSRNIIVLDEYESTDIKVTLDEYGSWTFYYDQTGYSAYGEWGSSEGETSHFIIRASDFSGCTIFKFTNSMNSYYVETLVIVK